MSTPTPTGPTPTPPGGELLPLISLAVEHVFDTLGRQSVFAPTILAVAADGQRGMWEHPDLEPEQAAATVAKISPRPTRAVAVFDGETCHAMADEVGGTVDEVLFVPYGETAEAAFRAALEHLT